MNNNTYGFNPEGITQAFNQIQSAFNDLDRNFTNGVDRCLTKLSNNWFSPEAMTFGEWAHDKSFTTYSINIVGKFSQRMTMLTAVCNEWARTVGSDYRCPSHNSPATSWQQVMFKDNKNGFVGVYSQNIQDINVDFRNVLNQFDTDSAKIINIIQSNPTFYGANQVESFINDVKSWKTTVTSLIQEIFNEMTTRVKETDEKYKSTAQANAQRFSSGN